MRRKDREITEIKKICEILESCKVFRIAMSVNDVPYIVPLNYGYQYLDEHFEFYFHCAGNGKKIDILRENNLVCFEVDGDHQLTTGDVACEYGYHYKSVIGMGEVSFVRNPNEKIKCLCNLMKHQTGKDFSFSEEQASHVTVCKIKVLELTAKQRTDIA